MEFTGERYVPNVGLDSEIISEHIQRYMSITKLVKGKLIVDAACGSGYGSHVLAEQASYVFGVDLSRDAVDFAKDNFKKNNLKYIQGSIDNLPFSDGTVEVLVSFETIEHVDGALQEKFLSEIKRVLKSDGLLIISSPDKKNYSERLNYKNKFHVKEFYRGEFKDFLSSYFNFVDLCDQYVVLSYILAHRSSESLEVLKDDKNFKSTGKYVIALCSNFEIEKGFYPNSIIVDNNERYQQKVDRVLELQDEIDDKNNSIWWLEGELDKERKKALARDKVLEDKIEMIKNLRDKMSIFQQIQSQIAALRSDVNVSRSALEKEKQRCHMLSEKLSHIKSTKAWKVIEKLYWLKNKIWRS